MWSPVSLRRVMTCSHNLRSFPLWSHLLAWFQLLSLLSNLVLKSRCDSSTCISKCPVNISLRRYLSDFRLNLSNPNTSLFPCLVQRNKQNNATDFLQVSVTVKGTAPLQGLQVDSSFDNHGRCPEENLISETRRPTEMGKGRGYNGLWWRGGDKGAEDPWWV